MRACYDAQSAENHHPGHQWSALLPGLARRQGKVAAYRRSRLCLKARGPPRLHSPVLGRPRGVNSDTRRPLGTRRDACGCRRDICVCLIKTGFDRSVGGAVWALTADPCPREAAAGWPANAARQPSIAAAAARRNRGAFRALLPPQRDAVAALTPPLRHRNPAARRCCCANAAAVAPKPWARKKRRMTSPRPST